MVVKRIVPNFTHNDPVEAARFYQSLFDLDIVMDHGWIISLASKEATTPQISVASQGGSGTPVPSVSIEVDDVDRVYEKALKLGADIVYDITDEDWGVRRFYVRDPSGMILNVLSHM
jgi:uncharacterized glyoxalase superfamily protein PhnB